MDVTQLPTLNAVLNATSGVLLVAGYVAIRRRRITTHRALMLSACLVSALFLTSYLVYHAHVGSKPFPGTGWLRTVYFAILIPHVVLAALLLPLAGVTLRRGLARRDRDHRRIARVTFPIWLFVSVTGVAVYLMLYGL
jgi:uncharacterized membrane protein YozB (DUF420 family)